MMIEGTETSRVYADARPGNCVRLAYLSEFTLAPIERYLKRECGKAGLAVETYFNDFGQHRRESECERSGLYAFSPDIVFLTFSPQKLRFEGMLSFHDRQIEQRIEEVLETIRVTVHNIRSRSNALIVLNNFIVDQRHGNGLLVTKERLCWRQQMISLNQRLYAEFASAEQLYVFDLDAFAANYGKQALREARDLLMWNMEVGLGALSDLAVEQARLIKATRRAPAKCLVVDLDNTLWGGVVGEDGCAGIRLGLEPPGNSFLAFQRALLSCYRRGVLLAINSKNNYDDALEVLTNHPHCLLRPEHFAAIYINWRDKAENIVAIARDLNLGLESLVFIDDSPAERLAVRSRCPEVRCIDLPEDPNLYVEAIASFDGLDALCTTEEDYARGKRYAEQRLRSESAANHSTLEEYLASLSIVAHVTRVREVHFDRVVQMCQRTNQFNLTTRRLGLGDIRAMSKREDVHLFVLETRDRFGEQGIVGFAAIERTPEDAHRFVLTDFLLSCRVIGRGVENAFLQFLIEEISARSGRRLDAHYRRTAKNAPCKDFLDKAGFAGEENEAPEQDSCRWVLADLERCSIKPAWIELHASGEA